MVSPAEELRRDSHFDPERYDPAAGGTVGDLLRRTREGFGQDIDAVAMQLRIRNNYLRAIETGRFRDLPGSTYAVGFVRTYAEYLGLDAQEVLRRFREEAADGPEQLRHLERFFQERSAARPGRGRKLIRPARH